MPARNIKWDDEEIEAHLKSAMDSLTPDIFDKLDLSTPQDPGPIDMDTPETAHSAYGRDRRDDENGKILKMYRRMRAFAVAAAACLALIGGGAGYNLYQNSRVDSVIGLDVNPSIQLSVNRNDKILEARPLNRDGEEILDDMDLSRVDMNIAVNAVIGSMVRHGYLIPDEMDENAILVTVTNSDKDKATEVRKNVVDEIADSLQEHNVSAVVYDQQSGEKEDAAVREIADRYGISYGKAYFLQELIRENGLEESDIEKFAGMSMGKIAGEINDQSLIIRGAGDGGAKTDVVKVTAAAVTEESTEESGSAEDTSESAEETTQEAASTAGSTSVQTTAEETTAAETVPTEEEPVNTGTIHVNYVDYESGVITVTFADKVEWKNASVSVLCDGDSYSARVIDTSANDCEIDVSGLPGGKKCSFTLAGVSLRGKHSYTSVSGRFETPDIADGAMPDTWKESEKQERDSEDDSEETTRAEKKTSAAERTEADTDPETENHSSEEAKDSSAESE
ncbi:MAG: hypothetical protein LIV11_00420 [Bacillota bacterium]|nr:hypothetical protein [Bacillota bacterium]